MQIHLAKLYCLAQCLNITEKVWFQFLDIYGDFQTMCKALVFLSKWRKGMVSLSVENWAFGRFPPSFCISYQFWVDFVCSSTHSLVVLENLLVASEVAQRKFKSSNFAYNLSTFLLASQNPKLIDCKFQFHKTTTNEISSNYRN